MSGVLDVCCNHRTGPRISANPVRLIIMWVRVRSKEEFGVTSGNQTRNLPQRRPCTNRLSTDTCSMLYSLQKSHTSCFVILIITIAVAKSEDFSYHVVFLDVSAHGNVQLVENCSCAVLTVTSWTCIVDCQCVRLQKNWYKVFI